MLTVGTLAGGEGGLLVMNSYLHGCKVAVGMARGHAHRGVDWGRWSRTVGSAGWARIVLATAPAEADAGVANGVALHLVDSHFSSMSLDELDETTALSWRDLDVGDFAESLEEGTQFVLRDVTGEASNEDSGVVGIGELVHRLRGTVVAHWWSAHGVHADRTALALHVHAAGRATGTTTLVLGSCGGDAHRAVAAVDTLHLGECTLLVTLIGESDESVAAGEAADWIGHDLGRFAGWELALEEGDKHVFVDLRPEIANEDRELRTAVVTAGKSQILKDLSKTKSLTCDQRDRRRRPSSA